MSCVCLCNKLFFPNVWNFFVWRRQDVLTNCFSDFLMCVMELNWVRFIWTWNFHKKLLNLIIKWLQLLRHWFRHQELRLVVCCSSVPSDKLSAQMSRPEQLGWKVWETFKNKFYWFSSVKELQVRSHLHRPGTFNEQSHGSRINKRFNKLFLTWKSFFLLSLCLLDKMSKFAILAK